MKTFIVRLNPDTRGGLPYSKYPTVKEYERIHNSSPMDGFHEAINFRSESGAIRGYLPPKHLASMRDGEQFTLITITAKTAKKDGDLLIGIQAGCKYVGQTLRTGKDSVKSLKLVWHYTCPESLSLLVDEPISGARALVLGSKGTWVRGPTFELRRPAIDRLMEAIKPSISIKEKVRKFENILTIVNNSEFSVQEEFEVESSFDDDVKSALSGKLTSVKGNESPSQKEVKSYQYVRDPKVVAYVLKKSKGKCGDCNNKGPFISKSTGLPYLEVHHKIMLKDGGPDTIENAIALCPNCHRKTHFG